MTTIYTQPSDWVCRSGGETYIAADGSDTPEADFPKTCSSYTPLAMFPGDSVFIASDSSRQSSVYAGSPYRPNTDCTWELELPPYSVLSCGEWWVFVLVMSTTFFVVFKGMSATSLVYVQIAEEKACGLRVH